MPTLCLLRHAKAAYPLPGQQDFDRPLTARGRDDAARIGAIVAGRPPGLALVSAAVRTRQTWEVAGRDIRPEPRLLVEPDLYHSTIETLAARLRAVADADASVVLVGHNPGLHELALWLGGDKGPGGADMRRKFPTAALAIFAVEPGWAALGPARARLEQFVTPDDMS